MFEDLAAPKVSGHSLALGLSICYMLFDICICYLYVMLILLQRQLTAPDPLSSSKSYKSHKS